MKTELEPAKSALLASWLTRSEIPLEHPLADFGEAVEKAGGLSDSEKAASLELPRWRRWARAGRLGWLTTIYGGPAA